MPDQDPTKSTISSKRGLAPGSAVFVGERRVHETRLDIVDFTEDYVDEREDVDVDECVRLLQRPATTWINVNGIHETELVEQLGREFGLHPLTVEDIVNTTQRPKLEEFDDYIFIVVRMLYFDDKDAMRLISEQVSFAVGQNFVISFQERSEDLFESVRARLRTNKGRVRRMGADYLAYALVDCIVDGYFVILESFGEVIERVEDEVIEDPRSDSIRRVHHLKREVLQLRKAVWPLREEISALLRSDSPIFGETARTYLRDVYDHVIRVIDTIETYRDLMIGIHDAYLSSLSIRMNEIMKVLTIVATIFIPLTFIAGVYGMNFQYMPELEWRWGYFGAWTVMAGIGVGMLLYFKRKSWL